MNLMGAPFRSYRSAQQGFEPPKVLLEKFANAKVVCEGWYPVCRSREIAPLAIKDVSIGTLELIVYRSASGALFATERACGHLGADLAKARVTDKGLECAFHRWCWNTDGMCVSGGGIRDGRRMHVYCVQERWGVVWLWAGKTPSYELPAPALSNMRHILHLPSQRIDCHPHVMLGNGLDFTHVAPVHRFHLVDDPLVILEPPHRLTVGIHGKFGPTFMRKMLFLNGVFARWRFTTIGPSIAWLKVETPTPFELLWAGRPLADGGCATQTVVFLPKWQSVVRALPMMIATTWADKKILGGLRFRQGFVQSDAVFYLYAKLIENLPKCDMEPT